MGGHWTDQFSFVHGAVRNRTTGYLALVGDEVAERKIPQAIFVVFHQNQWLNGADRKWRVAGMAVAKKPLEQLIAVAEWGDVLCMGSGDTHDEHVLAGKGGPKDRGPMRGARRIGDFIYACGMDRQVYRRDVQARWSDVGPKPRGKAKGTSGLEALDGFGDKEIYSVGWDGEIWKYDGKAWQLAPSPTNLVLVDVCCAGDGVVYACGRKGLLLRGRDQTWSIVDTGDMREDIWSLAWFEDRLYLSTMYSVYTLGPDGLQDVDMGKDVPESCYRLSTSDGLLWSIGEKDVMAFDGKNWTRVD